MSARRPSRLIPFPPLCSVAELACVRVCVSIHIILTTTKKENEKKEEREREREREREKSEHYGKVKG